MPERYRGGSRRLSRTGKQARGGSRRLSRTRKPTRGARKPHSRMLQPTRGGAKSFSRTPQPARGSPRFGFRESATVPMRNARESWWCCADGVVLRRRSGVAPARRCCAGEVVLPRRARCCRGEPCENYPNASTIGRNFIRVSASSISASESATIPAPAKAVMSPEGDTSAQRSATAHSPSPSAPTHPTGPA